MRSLQLRRKDVPAETRRQQAAALAPACRELGVVFLVNDHWELRLGSRARMACIWAATTATWPTCAHSAPDLIIGASCYDDIGRARAMLEAGADYIAFGAVFPSPTKPAAVRAPLPLFAQAVELARSRPAPWPAVVAIGGITPANAALVAQAGADAIAVITGLFEAPDVGLAATACARPFQSPRRDPAD